MDIEQHVCGCGDIFTNKCDLDNHCLIQKHRQSVIVKNKNVINKYITHVIFITILKINSIIHILKNYNPVNISN